MSRPSRPRVLMLLENCPYPQDDRVRREADTLTSAGYRVSVIAPRAPGQKRRESVAGVEVRRYRAPREGNGLLGYLWEYGWSLAMTTALALRLFVRPGFDTIHAHNPPDLFFGHRPCSSSWRANASCSMFTTSDPSSTTRVSTGTEARSTRRALVACERLVLRVSPIAVIVTNESYREVIL